jgi:trans-2,3-dihydro-3-hydroxyanthranilate isomerase
VPVTLDREGGAPFGRMVQPVPTVAPYERAAEVVRALGVDPALPIEVYDNGPRHVLVCAGSEAEVAALRPDLRALAALEGAVVSCFAGSGRRWKTRAFSPADGIDEDPATGSAAGPIAAHLARHGRIAFGDEIELAQGAEVGRPSTLFARASGTRARLERIEVAGYAVVVARGEFRFR